MKLPLVRFATLALILAVSGCSNLHWASDLVPAHDADLVVVNANVLTVDDRFPSAQAFAVRGGRITAVGDSASIRRHAGPKTRIIDAGGHAVAPGLAAGQLGPDQRVSRAEALRPLTIGNARFTGEEKIKGSLEPGKVADFIVLSEDPMTAPENRIEGIEVLLTAVGGKLVYVKDGLRF